MPSLFVSADEKFGVELLDDVPPEDDEEPIELPEVEPDEDGELEDEDGVLLEDDDGVLLDDEDGVLLEDEDDCATASVDSAKSTAAVMMLRDLGMDGASSGLDKTAPCLRASCVPLGRRRDCL